MNKEPKVEKSIIFIVWIYCAIVCLVLALINKSWIWPISFLLGTVTSLLAFNMTVKTVDRVIDSGSSKVRGSFIRNNILKYLVYVVVLGIASYTHYRHMHDETVTKYFNVFCVAAGLFSVKIMIYFKIFVLDKIFKKKAKQDYASEEVTEEEHLKLEEERRLEEEALKELEEKKDNDPFYEFDHKYDDSDKTKGGDNIDEGNS